MLVTPIDLVFVVAGLAVIVRALRRRWSPPPAAPAPSPLRGELVRTALALVPAAAGPNILVVALTPGMPNMPALVRWVLIPSLVLHVIVWFRARAAGYGRLTNRIWTGFWVGAAATAALDAFRLATFRLRMLPGNTPRMFGVLILDTMATGPTTESESSASCTTVSVGAWRSASRTRWLWDARGGGAVWSGD